MPLNHFEISIKFSLPLLHWFIFIHLFSTSTTVIFLSAVIIVIANSTLGLNLHEVYKKFSLLQQSSYSK
jgi:hypothetical protein